VCLKLSCLDSPHTFLIVPGQEGLIGFKFDGYIKELRVWGFDAGNAYSYNYMRFWKQRIPVYTRPQYLLLDRFRFVKYKVDSEIFSHYAP
jgi:hypothetical protein